MTPAIIFHDYQHALAALRASEATASHILLLTAAGAANYAGPDFLISIIKDAGDAVPDAKFEAVIDCGDDPGAVMTALRAGWALLLFVGDPEIAQKVESMAAQKNAQFLNRPEEVLDLLNRPDPDQAVLRWLQSRTKR